MKLDVQMKTMLTVNAVFMIVCLVMYLSSGSIQSLVSFATFGLTLVLLLNETNINNIVDKFFKTN